jgi:5-methylcytosine-specific restriction endonuclease McrA
MLSTQAIFTTSEAAEFLRTSPATLAQWRSEGRGPPYVYLGSRVRYLRLVLEEWLSADSQGRATIEEAADCHNAKRGRVRRPRGRAGAALRVRHLKAEPNCRDCLDFYGVLRPAEEIDHIQPWADGGSNDPQNLRSLCRPCHAVRTRDRLSMNR